MPKGVTILFLFFVISFATVIGVVVCAIVRENVSARVISKRAETIRGGSEEPDRTMYYAAFQMSDGEVQELFVSSHEYELLEEGDKGILSRRGALYKGFKRQSFTVAR